MVPGSSRLPPTGPGDGRVVGPRGQKSAGRSGGVGYDRPGGALNPVPNSRELLPVDKISRRASLGCAVVFDLQSEPTKSDAFIQPVIRCYYEFRGLHVDPLRGPRACKLKWHRRCSLAEMFAPSGLDN